MKRTSTPLQLAVTGGLVFALLVPVLLVNLGCAEATPTPQPVAQQSSNSIFVDEFNSVKGEWQQISGIWEQRNGYLAQTTDDPRQLNTIKYIQTPRMSDGTIQTMVRVIPFRPSQWTDSEADSTQKFNIRYIVGAGIVFRMKDANNYYMFRLAGEEGAVLGRMIDGRWNETDLCNPRVRDLLHGHRLGFREDNWYRLKVEAYGSRLQAYINDEPVCSVTDNTFSLGQVGLVTFKAAADFDWIRVTR